MKYIKGKRQKELNWGEWKKKRRWIKNRIKTEKKEEKKKMKRDKKKQVKKKK